MPGEPTPEISVIIVAGTKRERAANALASVLGQAEIERAEIILIDTALDRFSPIAGSNHPQVRTIQMSHEQHIGITRIYAARVARAPLVAYLEEHALAMPGWLKEILATFEQGDWMGVAGAAIPASQELEFGAVVHMLSFHPWTEDSASGEVDVMPGHNSAYRRDLLLSLDNLPEAGLPTANSVEQLMLIELILQKRLRELGHRFYFNNRIQWIHLNENRIPALVHNYFHWNMLFGASRVRGRSLAYRLLRVLSTPLILPVRVLKTLSRMHGRVDNDWTVIARVVPVVLLMHVIDMLGLGMGYLGLWQNAEKSLSVGELEVPREEPPRAYDLWQAPR